MKPDNKYNSVDDSESLQPELTSMKFENPLKIMEAFCESRSLRSSRELLWDLFVAALSGEDENYTGRQASAWAELFRQLQDLMEAAWEFNKASQSNTSLVAVRFYP